ncbi:MAG: hypothetical protein VX265_07430 [Myxococcota bacterium]|nr:hypothetical protein [Myxococcota bacterium]
MHRGFPCLALLLAAAPSVALAVPAQLTTQGRVLDADGQPLADTADVTFRLMDGETGGNSLWEETRTVSFDSGFYTVMLGTDEAGNPLEDSILDQWPLYLEVQLDGQDPMSPRMTVGSVPYARQAGVATELAPGAEIDAGSLTVGGTEVVASDGTWTGPSPVAAWSDLTGVPADFADEDDADTLADLVCTDGQWAVFDTDTAAWVCDGFSDSTLSDADVVVAVGTDAVDLYAGSTMDGYTILTEDSEIDWSLLVSVPAGLDDGDDDTLAGLSCTEGQLAVYDTAGTAWVCGDDTDTTLTAAEVVAAVEAATGVALSGTLTVAGDTVLTDASAIDWSQLVSVPTGVADGDDDTLATLACGDGALAVYSTGAGTWACGTDTDTTLTDTEVIAAVEAATGLTLSGSLVVGGNSVLTTSSAVAWSQLSGVPSGLADGDDDMLAATACADGEVLVYSLSSSSWACGTDTDTTLTSAEVQAMVEAVSGLALAAGATVDGGAILTDADHGADPDAHHSSTSDGIDITPASVTIQGTSTSLTDGSIDLGSSADDALSASMVQTLTGGGSADALHSHAATGGGGGGCYTAWGTTSCLTGYSSAYAGTGIVQTFRFFERSYTLATGGVAGPVCVADTALTATGTAGHFAEETVAFGGDTEYSLSAIVCTLCCPS